MRRRRPPTDPRQCTACSEWKPLTEYYVRSNGYVDVYCKLCRKKKTKENFDPDRQREYCRRQRIKDPERVKSYCRESYLRHQADRQRRQREYYHAHVEHLREYNRERMRRIRAEVSA